MLRFKDDFTMTLVSESNLQLCKGLTHGGYQGRPMEVTFVRVADARAASFLAAFTWGRTPVPPALRIAKNTPEEILLEIEIASRAYTIRIKPAKRAATVQKGSSE